MSRESRIARLRTVSLLCAGFGMAVGALAFLGWILDSDVLRGGTFADIIMKTNTAIALVLTGSGLALLGPESRSTTRARLGQACAVLVIVIGLATLSQHAFGWNLHIDELLFREAPGAAGTQSPNRMGPPASTCLPVLGLSLLLLDHRTAGGGASQALALSVMVAALVSILGYVFGAHELFGIARYTAISFPTAIAFFVLGFGVIVARPQAGWMQRLVDDDVGSVLVRRLLPAALFLPVVLMYLRVLGERAGLYDLYFGRALVVLSFVLAFTALVWFTGGVLSRQERLGRAAETALRGRLVATIAGLRESEDMFRTVGEAVPDLLSLTDAVGRAGYCNPAWDRFAGSTAGGGSVAAWRMLTHPDDRPTFDATWTDAQERRQLLQCDVRLRRHDGVERWFSVRIVPVPDDSRSDAKWIFTGTDVQDQRSAQEAIRSLDRRKNAFLATLAHELRNPLAPVRNAVAVLGLTETDPARAQWARAVIDRQVDHLARLIDDLMDVSRITHDRLELRKAPLVLSQVIGEAIESSRHALERNRHRLEVQLPNEPIHLDADAIRLVQVFMNLLTNAARYTPPGGRITLAAEREGSEVVVRVSDTGVGIAPDQVPHLFEMFYQTADVRQQSNEGLGIGLAIVHHLVRLHEGTVSAHSPGKGKGATLTVRLPTVPTPLVPTAISAVPAADSKVRLRTVRALVVDDNVDAAESLAILLQFEGAEVETAHDGDEALAAAERVRPHVVLLDIGLPKRTGDEVAREIRRSSWGARTLIIAMTGWGQPHDRARSRDAGFDHHLVKPVSIDTILDLVDASVASRSSQSETHGLT